MVCGVSLFGLLTANVSAKFLKNDALLAYEQLAATLHTGRSCPNCGHTPPLHDSDADPASAPEATAAADPAELASVPSDSDARGRR